KAKLSDSTFKYLLGYLFKGLTLLPKAKLFKILKQLKSFRHEAIESLFSDAEIGEIDASSGEDIVIEGVILTASVLKELVAIAKQKDSSLRLRYIKVGDTENLFFEFKTNQLKIDLPFNPRPFTDRQDADCIGEYEIDLNGNVDFGYSIDT